VVKGRERLQEKKYYKKYNLLFQKISTGHATYQKRCKSGAIEGYKLEHQDCFNLQNLHVSNAFRSHSKYMFLNFARDSSSCCNLSRLQLF
jgi:hypothetical protein